VREIQLQSVPKLVCGSSTSFSEELPDQQTEANPLHLLRPSKVLQPWLPLSRHCLSVSICFFIFLMPSPISTSSESSTIMKLELQSASNFLVHLVRLGRANLSEPQLDRFKNAVVEVLRRRYRDHWFPEKPYKGSGYRCIRINGKLDPVIVQAGESCGLSPQLIRSTFPSELTMWIDPLEVSYRIGENGSICVLYEFKDGAVNEPWKPNVAVTNNANVNKTPSNLSLDNKNKLLSHNNQKNLKIDESTTTTTPAVVAACKDSLRKMDYLLDPRKSVSIEQLAAYVSS
jgi:hypothetical protein